MAEGISRNTVWAKSAKALAHFVEEHKLTHAQAGSELGLASSTISGYLTNDKMPFTVELAVKYLDDSRKDPDGVKHYLLTTEGEQLTCKFIDELEEITIGGNRYKMVPI